MYCAGSQGNQWGRGSGMICLSVNGCLPWQRALWRLRACSDGNLLSRDESDLSLLIVQGRLLTERIWGLKEAQRFPSPLPRASPCLCFLSLGDLDLRDNSLKRKEKAAQNPVRPASLKKPVLHPTPTSRSQEAQKMLSPHPQLSQASLLPGTFQNAFIHAPIP